MRISLIFGMFALVATGCQGSSSARNNGERHGLFSGFRNNKRQDNHFVTASPVPVCTPVVMAPPPCPPGCAPSPCP